MIVRQNRIVSFQLRRHSGLAWYLIMCYVYCNPVYLLALPTSSSASYHKECGVELITNVNTARFITSTKIEDLQT